MTQLLWLPNKNFYKMKVINDIILSDIVIIVLYDDFDQKVKNIHNEMDLNHSYKKKACKRHIIK